MTGSGTHMDEFDLQPHPRILPMLGEINLTQWRCIAELVDNAVDAFLNALRDGHAIEHPEVYVSLPTTDVASAKITIRDNGPGMDPVTLENAVRAGWTGNDPINNLGMFGMGFNIATARLGTVTKVWTTRKGDTEWCGLEIDFDRLSRQRHYRTPVLTRPKNDPLESGTEISIERLKPEQRQWFARTPNRTRMITDLARTYSAMLRPGGVPLSFRLTVNRTQVRGRQHCIWDGVGNPSRTVDTARYGPIDSFQTINAQLGERPFCTRCWQWLPYGEAVCATCGLAEDVIQRQRTIHGWLGIQRYLHGSDYGVDFLRHGRKIEIANKDMFFWTGDSETPEEEYPIDDPRHRGRIVGEIHIDHCRVTYTKDRFDRNDPAWEEMVLRVRGEGPLRPDKAEQQGYAPNQSPLFLLFQAFRRSSPKPKVAGCYAKLLIVPDNDRAEEMARYFYDGVTEYQTDAKWWELVEEADRQLLVPPTPTDDAGGGVGEEGFGPTGDGGTGQPEPGPGGTGTTTEEEPSQPVAPPVRVPIPSLSRDYRDDSTAMRWEVRAYKVMSTDPELGDAANPWKRKATPAGIHEFFINTEHPIFRSATMTPMDALLAELAWSAMDFQRGNNTQVSFAQILASLRDRYAITTKLDPVTLSGEASLTISAISRSLPANIESGDGTALFGELSPIEQEAVQRKMATRTVQNPQQVISDGHFLEYAPLRTVLHFFETHPEYFLDGRYWDTAFSALDYGSQSATEEAQTRIVRYYAGLLEDAIWLVEQDPIALADISRTRLLRAALALELLSPGTSRGDE